MGIKTYKAYTPSRRNMTGSDFSEITKKTPEKSLLAKNKKTAGRILDEFFKAGFEGGRHERRVRKIAIQQA